MSMSEEAGERAALPGEEELQARLKEEAEEAPDMAELNPTSNVEVYERLVRCRTDEDRIRLLDEQIAALGLAAERKRAAAQAAYLERNSPRFRDVDPKLALCGAPTRHDFAIKGVATYALRPPSGDTVHKIGRFRSEAGALAPVTQSESIVLGWLIEVKLDAAEAPQSFEDMDMARKLGLLRQLPGQLLDRLAEECMTLETWLGIYLEAHLGNS